MKNTHVIVGSAAFGLMLWNGYLPALEPETFHLTEESVAQEEIYSPYATGHTRTQFFFGDTHVPVLR